MKNWIITLPLLCVVGIATAEDKMPVPAAKPEAAMATETAKPAEAAPPMRHKTKRLPRGDLRKCLDLKDDMAIIRCAETGRKK